MSIHHFSSGRDTLLVIATLKTVLLISAGAVIGANLRYFVAQYVLRHIPSSFPYGTLLINITASFILGCFLIWSSGRLMPDPRWRYFFAIGFCATYSTYSSYAYETFALFEKGQLTVALMNVLATNVLCFISVALGAALGRRF